MRDEIKIITEPVVAIIGRTAADLPAITRWVAASGGPDGWTPDPTTGGGEHVVETATRACYWSFASPRPGGFKALAERVLSEGHGSTLEHSVFTVAISGISRALSLELIRHRHLSPSQLSQRYYDESDAAFVVPPALLDEVKAGMAFFAKYRDVNQFDSYTDAHDRCWPAADEGRPIVAGLRWLAGCERACDEYRWFAHHLLAKCADIPGKTHRLKLAREAARSVLPNCVETRIVLTGNLRAFRGALEQRGTETADREINRLAIKLLPMLQAESPNLMGDMALNDGPSGPCITTPYRKV